MKKLLLFFLGVLLAFPGIARDFTYEYEGQTLTYTVMSEEEKTCMTKEGNYPTAGNDISGNLIIPSVVNDGEFDYIVTSIGDHAFYGCSKLISVDIPNSVTSIGWFAFEDCSKLTSINLPNSISSIGPGAFRGCESLLSVTIPEAITSIDGATFYGCSHLTSVSIPNSVTSIGSDAFKDCNSLTSIIIPNSVTSIDISAFSGCSHLTSVSIPNSVTTIGSNAFENCSSMTDASLGDSVSFIDTNTFSGCSNLTSVTIGKSVTSIANYAFNDCLRLRKIVSYAIEPPHLDAMSFPWGAFTSIDLSIYFSAEEAYRHAEYWRECRFMGNILTSNRHTQSITWSQLFDDVTLGNIIELNAASTSGLAVEYTTSDMEVAKIDGNTVKFIGEGEVTITASQPGNDDYEAAEDVSKNIIVRASQNDQVEILYDFEDNGLYYKKVSDSEVVITPISKTLSADGVTYQSIDIDDLDLQDFLYYNGESYRIVGIAAHAFENSSISQVHTTMWPSENFYIGESAFENCWNLSSVNLYFGMDRIETRAFYGCANLKTIALGPVSVMQEAFINTPNLQYLFITGDNPYGYTFDNCFRENISTITCYIPSDSFKNNDQFSSFNLEPYGYFDKFEVTYTGQIPEGTPVFHSNLPGDLDDSGRYWQIPNWEINAGTYTTTAYIRIGGSYPISIAFDVPLPFEYTITPAPLTLSTGDYERAYGEPNPEIKITVEGYLNGNNESIFTYKPEIIYGAEHNLPDLPNEKSDVGVYNIYAWGELPYGSNYKIEGWADTPRGTITIVPADQTLAWEIEDEELNVGDVVPLEAVSTSGLSVEFISSDPDIAKIEDNNVYFLKEGEVTITASQPGNKNYNAAESISRSLVINPRTKDDSLTLNVSESKMKPEETLQLVIDDYEWTSSDERVATVSESGLVTAVAGGDAVITLSRKSDGATLATCVIKVDSQSSTSDLSVKKGVEIKCIGNEIRIKGASSSSKAWVYDMKGQTIYSGLDRIIPLESGIYIVSIDGSQLKVNIR